MTLRSFGLDDARSLRFVRNAGLLPDGRVFHSVLEVDGTNSLWLDGKRVAEQLADFSSPALSPDGTTFALVAEAGGTRQVCLVPVEGGPVKPLSSLPQGAGGGPVWSPDGSSIAFTAGPQQVRDASLPYRVDRATYRFDGLGYLDDVVQDIYVVDVASGDTKQLTADRFMNTDPTWSPDGRSLAYLVSFAPDEVWNFLPQLHVLDVATGDSRLLVGTEWGGVFAITWTGRGIVLAGVPNIDGRPANMLVQKLDLWMVDPGGGKPVCRTAGVLAGIGTRSQADLPSSGELTGTRICVVGDHALVGGQVRGDNVVYRVALDGAEQVETVLAEAGASLYLAAVSPGGDLLHQRTTFTEPPELLLGSTRLTHLNDEIYAEATRPVLHTLEATASDGLTTDVWALTPAGVGPWPSLLYVHGGPYGAYGSTYEIDFELLVGAGYAVVFHNFRGSGGYGPEFSEKIFGDWGKAGELDHHAAVDAAIAAGIADPDRLGVCGLSHGGFATCWLIGTSDRFKAAVAENPVTSFTGSWGYMDVSDWVTAELRGKPWEIPDVYRDGSPLTYAPECTTPTLFVIGEHDWRCHQADAEQYYRVLKSNGVPTEMMRLPNASHVGSWTGTPAVRHAQNEALLDWFERYLPA